MATFLNHSAPSTAAVATRAPDRPLRVVYADDVHELRDVVRITLTREGHHIECFADGELALGRFVVDRNFDLIITDHHMPNMNGLEFVTQLRARNFAGRIMVFSSELSEAVAEKYRALKVDRILYKPVFPSALRTILAELFPASESAAA